MAWGVHTEGTGQGLSDQGKRRGESGGFTAHRSQGHVQEWLSGVRSLPIDDSEGGHGVTHAEHLTLQKE